MFDITNHKGNTNENPKGDVNSHPVRMASIKQTIKQTHQKITSVAEDGEKLEPFVHHRGWKLAQPMWKTVGQFLETLNMGLSRDPANPLLGGCPQCYSGISTFLHISRVIIYNSRKVEANKCLI